MIYLYPSMYTFFFEKLIGVPTFSQVWLPWLVPFSLLAGHTTVTRTPRLRPVNAVNAILRWIAFRLVVHRIWLRKTLLPAVNIAALKVNIAQPPFNWAVLFLFLSLLERTILSFIYIFLSPSQFLSINIFLRFFYVFIFFVFVIFSLYTPILGFTEQHYKDHPEDYKTHPATFLVQHSTLDENADTCAARNYHAEMIAHGGDSTLMLVPANQERCYCTETCVCMCVYWGARNNI